jgi:hypothetical protein
MRRTIALGVALLLVLAAAGSLCLMSPSSAMGMPMKSAPTAPGDCDGTGEGSMANCPYADHEEVQSDIARADPGPLSIALAAATVQPPLVFTGAYALLSEVSSSPPPTHLTPLRL